MRSLHTYFEVSRPLLHISLARGAVSDPRTSQNHDFTYAHTPIITSNDTEGAGETFRLAPVLTPASASAASSSDAPTSYEFFSKPSYLTVSSQLHLEALAHSVSRVWTLSPCFRAERSMTSRHLAEFWMLEAEWAFTNSVDELTRVVEGALKHVLKFDSPDRQLLWKDRDASHLAAAAGDAPWARMTYGDAIKALQEHGGSFKFPPAWGRALASEHERWLAEKHVGGPVFVTDYPATLKPFYMLRNADGETAACFDLLVPGVGELAGGSLREDRLDRLETALEEHNLPKEEYWWYLDLRKYGGAPHGGFGLGFERMISWLAGNDSVRESIPMPRWSKRMIL